MAIYKNDNGTWYVMIRYQDWTGARKQKCKRGFSTRKEAADWELQFKLQKKASVDMTMESFCTMYEEDIRPSLKQSTWLKERVRKEIECNGRSGVIQQVQNSPNRGRERKVQAGIPGKEGNTGKLSLVEILADHFITGACHAPVNIRQGESR